MKLKSPKFKPSSNIKAFVIFVTLASFALLCVLNILYIMIFKTHFYSGVNILEFNQNRYANNGARKVFGKRGTIYDRSGEVIAQDEVRYTLIAYLNEERIEDRVEADGSKTRYYHYVRDVDMTAKKLAPILDMDENDIKDILNNAKKANRYQAELGYKGKNLVRATKDEIDALELEGIDFTTSVERNYPTAEFASHLIGFANYDEQVIVPDQSTLEANMEQLIKNQSKDKRELLMELVDVIDSDKVSLNTSIKQVKKNIDIEDEASKARVEKCVDKLGEYLVSTHYESRIKGKLGLEYTLDKQLRGEDGLELFTIDRDGYAIPNTSYMEKYAKDGNDIYLTLDRNVQLALQNSLKQTLEETKATRAWGIVMEVETGKILGWGSIPTFDMNKRDLSDYLNIPSDYLYEPGSVMKGITYAAAIDSKKYPYRKTFDSGVFYYGTDEKGKIYRSDTPVAGFSPIRDALNENHGTITFDKGFVVSSNIGICELLTNYMDFEIFQDYVINKFKFTKSVDIPYVNNMSGNMQSSYASDKLSTGFGQGISINALQMVQAYSAIFNDGQMVRPYVVDSIVNPTTNEIVEQYDTEIVGQPISKETAKYMQKLMERVVSDEDGTGHYRYQMSDVDIIAKTGTGQIANEQGVYGDLYTMSVMAAAPADNPKVMVYYMFESENYLGYSGDPFKEVMKAALVAGNITKDSDKQVSEEKEEIKEFKQYDMPSLINHSIDYAKKKMENIKVETVYIGDGNSVIDQYPKANSSIVSSQRCFILTDGDKLVMPNMTNWTRKDINAFWKMSGISIVSDGFGRVVSQSIEAGASIDKTMEIEVKME